MAEWCIARRRTRKRLDLALFRKAQHESTAIWAPWIMRPTNVAKYITGQLRYSAWAKQRPRLSLGRPAKVVVLSRVFASVRKAVPRVRRLELHFPPKHASWLTVTEIGPSLRSEQCHEPRTHDQAGLWHELPAWVKRRNTAKATSE